MDNQRWHIQHITAPKINRIKRTSEEEGGSIFTQIWSYFVHVIQLEKKVPPDLKFGIMKETFLLTQNNEKCVFRGFLWHISWTFRNVCGPFRGWNQRKVNQIRNTDSSDKLSDYKGQPHYSKSLHIMLLWQLFTKTPAELTGPFNTPTSPWHYLRCPDLYESVSAFYWCKSYSTWHQALNGVGS